MRSCAFALLVFMPTALLSAEPVELTVVYTAETHAALYPCDCPFEPDGGIARRATAIKRIRADAKGPVLVMDAGGWASGGIHDEYSVSSELDTLRLKTYFHALKAMKYDALGIGNNELRFGLDALARDLLPPPLNFSPLCNPGETSLQASNLKATGLSWVTPVRGVMLESGRVVRSFSVTSAEGAYAGIRVTSPVEAARRAIGETKVPAAAIVCLADLGEAGATKLARAVPEIDLIIVGGKRETRRDSFRVGNTLLVLPQYQGRRLGAATAMLREGKRPRFTAKLIRLSPEIPDDPEMVKLLESYESAAAPLRKKVPLVEIDLYKMAHCPYCGPAERALAEAARALPGKIRVRPYFIVGERKDGSLESLHGPEELAEDLRQAAIAEFYPGKYWDYALWRQEHPDAKWKPAARKLGILPARIRGAVASGEAEQILRRHLARTRALRVEGSPTIFINRRRFDGAAARGPLLLAICKALQSAASEGTASLPKICDGVPRCFRDADCIRAGTVGECLRPGKPDAQCRQHPPVPYEITVVADANALHAPAPENIESLLELMPGGKVTRIDANTAAGRQWTARHKITRLPAYFLDERAKKARRYDLIAGAVRKSSGSGLIRLDPDKLGSHQFISRTHRPGRLDVFVEASHRQAAEVIVKLQERLAAMKRPPEVRIRYAAYRSEDGRIAASGGIAEIEEALRQIGVRREFPDKFMAYVLARAKVPGSSWWDDACRRAGLDPQAVKRAARAAESLAELEADVETLASLGTGGPTVFLAENQEVIPIGARADLERLLNELGARREDSSQ